MLIFQIELHLKTHQTLYICSKQLLTMKNLFVKRLSASTEITIDEVLSAVRSLKRNKAVGVDKIPAEILKVPSLLL